MVAPFCASLTREAAWCSAPTYHREMPQCAIVPTLLQPPGYAHYALAGAVPLDRSSATDIWDCPSGHRERSSVTWAPAVPLHQTCVLSPPGVRSRLRG